jgi:trehalose-6-phosphate synthase
MKNIHIIPTNKPSRLCIDNSCNELNYSEIEGLNSKHITNQNIYITSDEEIKDGDYHISSDGWFIDKATNEDLEIVNEKTNGYRKIILTTDQDLIKEGVQAIDDEFLEWFVKNPSCEEVEVERGFLTIGGWVKSNEEAPNKLIRFKITIPKEEPKDVVLGYKTSLIAQMLDSKETSEEPKQTKQMYSEEEVLELLHDRMIYTLGSDYQRTTTTEWFKQFKK